MEIQEKLLKFKFHIVVALISSLVLISLIILAPSFLTLLAYFWPLLLSTALFLVAVIFFAKTSASHPYSADDSSSSSPSPSSSSSTISCEAILDYVASPHHPPVELVQPSHHHDYDDDEASVEETFKSE